MDFVTYLITIQKVFVCYVTSKLLKGEPIILVHYESFIQTVTKKLLKQYKVVTGTGNNICDQP